MRVYQVQIGPRRDAPRLSFEAIAESSVACFQQHVDLAEVGERVEILAIDAAGVQS